MAAEDDARAEERANCRRAVAILGCYRGVDLETVNRALLAIDDLGAPRDVEPSALSNGYERLRARWLWWRNAAMVCLVAALCGMVACFVLGEALAVCIAIEADAR